MKVPGSDRLELPAIDRATYELLAEVAHTANGTVWRAKSFLLLREVAIKLIPAERDSSGRTLREARIASQLDHPNIVRVHSFGTWDDQQTALVMEWIEGESLNDLLSREGSLANDVELLTAIFSQVLSAVEFAHKHGVIHRDIKPANIMLSGTTGVKLVDFGIARPVQTSADEQLTVTGTAIGSPHYMSPEQCSGRKCDCRTDIYSLGVVLFQCICGRLPFEVDSVFDVMYQHLHAPLDEVRRLLEEQSGEAMADLVCKCLSKDPESRYQSVGQLSIEFEKAMACTGKAKRPIDPARIGSVAIAVVVVLSLVLLTVVRKTSDEAARQKISSVSPGEIGSVDLALVACRNINNDEFYRAREFRKLLDHAEKGGDFARATVVAAELLLSMDKSSCTNDDIYRVTERLIGNAVKTNSMPNKLDVVCLYFIPSLVSAHGASELSLKCSDQLTAMFTRCQRPVSAAHVKHSKAKLLFERLALDDALREISASAKLYEQIPERSKDHIDYLELLVLRGQVYAISGNQAEAEKIMQQLARQACAVAGDPSRRASIVAEAGYYYVVYCKKTTIGENLFQDAVQLSDDVVTKWRLLLRKGYAYMQRRDVTAVERVLSEMRLLLPVPEGHKDIQCQYNEIMIQVMVMKGNVKARELIEKQLDYCADYPYLRPYKSRTYWLRGLALLEEGNAESGLQNLKLSINHMGPITDAKLKGLLQEYVGLVERKEYGKTRWKALQARANRAVGLQW